MSDVLRNYVAGKWTDATGTDFLPVRSPATGETIALVPCSSPTDVGVAARAGEVAFREWSRVPCVERVEPLFRLKGLLESAADDLARSVTVECGKTLSESLGEVRRGIENVANACGMPSLMQGTVSEDIARGIDEFMIRQPLGVVAAITPFNFPAMIPLWFLPYAVATGNCFLLKPSERTPMASQRLMALIVDAGFPPGAVQLVNGDRRTAEAIVDHPAVRAVSFVGTTAVAKAVYSRATSLGKRAQCQGGAKNPAVIMPDADPSLTVRNLADSAFGCAGQRCLAVSVAVVVDENNAMVDALAEVASTRRVGNGLDPDTEMGPVITDESRRRIEASVERALADGAKPLVDGRGCRVPDHEGGFFTAPTILSDVATDGDLARTEVFGPVLALMRAGGLDDAIRIVNGRRYGNQASIYTSDGAAARRFRVEASAGNIGVNVGVAAPMAFFPFSGWNDSFMGDLHGQGAHAVEFYTQTKVVVERWGAPR